VFELIGTLLVVFLAGVGLGTFVLGSRIRAIVAEAVAAVKAEEQKIKTAIKEL